MDGTGPGIMPGFFVPDYDSLLALVEEERLEIGRFGNCRMDGMVLALLSELEQTQLGVLLHGRLPHDILQLALLHVERAG
jgi:hypothetical protein